jgi:RNA polymerase sigma-70 factor (ECF subfamily)
MSETAPVERLPVLESAERAERAERAEQLISAHGAQVQRWLRRFGVSDGDVDDAAQRVFLTALGKLSVIRDGRESAFLRAVALREASHARRSRERRREAPDDVLESQEADSLRPDELAVRKARATTLDALMSGMHTELERVLRLVELDGHAIGDVARSLGIPLGTCKSRLRRAKSDLSTRIDALPDSVRALIGASDTQGEAGRSSRSHGV